MNTIKFRQLPICQPEQRTHERPLGLVSDFVVEDLPHVTQAGDVRQLRAITQKLDVTHYSNNPHLALLDLKFLERAFLTLKETRPDILAEATSRQSQVLGKHPALSYEDVIIRNPLRTDPRFFSPMDFQPSEHLFYAVHREIELHCCAIFKMMRSIVEDPFYAKYNPPRSSVVNPILDLSKSILSPVPSHKLSPVNDATFAKEVAPSIAGGIIRIHRALERLQAEMPVEHFSSLRRFFQPDKERHAPGPSGKFSAGIYCIDECIAPQEFASFNAQKMEEIDFFPTTSVNEDQVAGQEDMRHISSTPDRRSIVEVLQKIEENHQNEETDIIRMARLALPRLMKDFRALHYRILLQFVPELKRNTFSTGTGGEQDVKKYVAEPIRIYDQLSQKNHE